MNTREKIHDATLAKWLSFIHDQRASSMTVKDWCADNSISVHAFYYWKRIAKVSYVDTVILDNVPIPAPTLPANKLRVRGYIKCLVDELVKHADDTDMEFI